MMKMKKPLKILIPVSLIDMVYRAERIRKVQR